MKAHATKSKGSSHDCGCGCGGSGGCGCESQCCELECLVRPNFYCGQLLTDVDLDALVEWTRKRFALSRYRDGWGVVCGLDVTCSAPDGARSCCGSGDGDGPFVYVTPGYAVDCCGNDLVVCEPIKVDLSGVCLPEGDPCAKPKPAAAAEPPRAPRGTSVWQACFGEGERIDVDLYLRYHEDLRHGERPLFGGKCGQDRACEYARVAEQPCVVAKIADSVTTPRDEEKAFEERRQKAVEAMAKAVDGGARAIREYLREHPIGRLCFIEDLRCCFAETETRVKTGTPEEVKEARVALDSMKGDLVRWLYMDWVWQQEQCPCAGCKPDEGVPIGRVALLRGTGTDGRCRVLMVDLDDDYRRPLSKDPCGLPASIRDRRGMVGMRREQAEAALIDGGHTVDVKRDVNEFQKALGRPIVRIGGAGDVELHVARDPLGVERVIAAVNK